MNKNLALLFSVFSFASGYAVASDNQHELGKCESAGILDSSMFSDVPWNAMYPIRLAGITIGPKGSGAPANATTKAFCACEDDMGIYVPGFTQSMYEPARLIELVREPDCMMTLGGAEMGMTNGRMRGGIGHSEQGEGQGAQSAFWHYHYFSYPLLLMLEMVIANRCGDGYLSMDLLYVSELDPTWDDAELAFFANPESTIFANPISLAACIADAGAAAIGKPLDSLFWCAGAWGGIYPLSGHVNSKASIPSKTSLLATRSVAALHRRLLARQTVGDDALCSAPLFPTIPKSQYKMNMMYPVPERRDTHEIGEPALQWGEWRNIPSREDNVYMLWRYNDCCTTYY
ncbi:conjugal transfer protein TraU [Vibrio aestuarianus subsp. cardii]|uniref:TraU family protein n=1 Tax=Vibrio aestuarianus TaxID=28171 RepID=UPI001558B754|nr:TraU family protein [Vibrio aestuarianus]NGZ66621.1 conjugal transfer protein TraU [Vibrio aestuarianus subsp. cardii]